MIDLRDPPPRDLPAHVVLVAYVFDLAGLRGVADRLRTPSAAARRSLRDQAYLFFWGLPVALGIAAALGLLGTPPHAPRSGPSIPLIGLLVLGFLVTAGGVLLAVVLDEWRLFTLWLLGVVLLIGQGLPYRPVLAVTWGVVAVATTVWWFTGPRRRSEGT